MICARPEMLIRASSDEIGQKYARAIFEHTHTILYIKLSEDDLARVLGRIIHETGEALMRDVMDALEAQP